MPFGTGLGGASYGESLVTADFTGDGILDLAVTDADFRINIFRANGDTTFTLMQSLDASDDVFAFSLAHADFDGDGNLDLVTGNFVFDSVSLLLGNGDGTFEPATNYGAGHGAGPVATGDFDGDGHADLAISIVFRMEVALHLGAGDGSLIAGEPVDPDSVPTLTASAFGDLNGDGIDDWVTEPRGGAYGEAYELRLGRPDGTYDTPQLYGSGGPTLGGAASSGVAIVDFDGDGRLDVIVSEGTVYLMRNQW